MSLLSALFSRWFGASRPPIDREAFTQRFADRLRMRLPDAEIEILAPLSLSITRDGGRGQVLLGNVFRAACAAEDELERAEIVERHLAVMAGADAADAAGPDDIVPLLKPGLGFDNLPAPAEGVPVRPRVEPFAADLSIVYAVDLADTVSFVGESWFAARGIPAEGLRQRAVDNLRGKLPGLDVQRGGGLNMVLAGGHYESSLLLFDDFWARESTRLRGDPVIAIPARDVLLFADAAHARAVDELRRQAEAVHADAAYALTPRCFRRHADGRIEPFGA